MKKTIFGTFVLSGALLLASCGGPTTKTAEEVKSAFTTAVTATKDAKGVRATGNVSLAANLSLVAPGETAGIDVSVAATDLVVTAAMANLDSATDFMASFEIAGHLTLNVSAGGQSIIDINNSDLAFKVTIQDSQTYIDLTIDPTLSAIIGMFAGVTLPEHIAGGEASFTPADDTIVTTLTDAFSSMYDQMADIEGFVSNYEGGNYTVGINMSGTSLQDFVSDQILAGYNDGSLTDEELATLAAQIDLMVQGLGLQSMSESISFAESGNSYGIDVSASIQNGSIAASADMNVTISSLNLSAGLDLTIDDNATVERIADTSIYVPLSTAA